MQSRSELKQLEPNTEQRQSSASSLSDILRKAEQSYIAYREAQKDVAEAYRACELEAEADYRRSVNEAQALLDINIRQATETSKESFQMSLEIRIEAMSSAEQIYLRTLEDVEKAHEEAKLQAERESDAKIWQALRAYQDKLNDAVKKKEEASRKARGIYAISQQIGGLPTLEASSEIELLLSLSSSADPVLAELWENERDAAYDRM